jgi:hypothetical protein
MIDIEVYCVIGADDEGEPYLINTYTQEMWANEYLDNNYDQNIWVQKGKLILEGVEDDSNQDV